MQETLPVGRILLGDCIEIMRQFPNNSVDLIATDPPYGLSFMGKDWDTFKATRVTQSQVVTNLGAGMKRTTQQENINYQHWVTTWAKECLRVLKDGAFMFCCMTPRQDLLSRALIGLEDAGFDVGFTSIYWTYSSGFPKSMNIGLAIDKRECKRLLQEKLNRKPTRKEFEEEWKNFRKIIGIDPLRESRLINQKEKYITESGWSAGNRNSEISEPRTPKAKELDGSFSGFQPKPACEVIVVAMKPLNEKSYIEQAIKNKKGITWLNDCRIFSGTEHFRGNVDNIVKDNSGELKQAYGFHKEFQATDSIKGRFPANLLVSDDILNDGTVISYGKSKQPYSYKNKKYKVEGFIKDNSPQAPSNYGDIGSYSRYFDLDIWFEKQFEKLPENVRKVFPFLIISKAAKSEKNKGLTGGTGSNTYNRKCLKCNKWERNQGIDKEKYTCNCEKPEWETPKGNFHPTTKPIKLMSYLITLGSRENDVVLDPFLGSGTTAIAAKMLKRKYIGIELSKEYFDIAQKRLVAVEETLL